MTYLRAAEAVLREARRPLSAREITELALSKGLIQPRGRTPVKTMDARLYTAPLDVPIRREYQPGPRRAARGSVRWKYVDK